MFQMLMLFYPLQCHGIVVSSGIFLPNTMVDIYEPDYINVVYGKMNAYKTVNSKIQIYFNNNWIDCFDKPTDGVWTVADIDESKVIFVNYRKNFPGETNGQARTVIDTFRFIKSKSGCILDTANANGDPANFPCAVLISNFANFDNVYPQADTTLIKVVAHIKPDAQEVYVYADLKTPSNELRIFAAIDLTDPTYNSICSGQYQSNIQSKVFMTDDFYPFRVFDMSNDNYAEITGHKAYTSSNGFSSFGAGLMQPIAYTLGFTGCQFGTGSGSVPYSTGTILNIAGSVVPKNNQFESFFVGKDSIYYLNYPWSNDCATYAVYHSFPNAIFFQGQHLVTFDNATKLVGVHYSTVQYSGSGLDFTMFIKYANVSEVRVDTMPGKFILYLRQGTRIRMQQFSQIIVDSLSSPVGGDVQYDPVGNVFLTLQNNPNYAWIMPIYTNDTGLGVSIVKSGGSLKYSITNPDLSFTKSLTIGPEVTLSANSLYQIINNVSYANTSIDIIANTVDIGFSSAQYLAMTKFYNKTAIFTFSTCAVGACSLLPSKSSIKCQIPRDYASSNANGTLTIAIGDIIKIITVVLNRSPTTVDSAYISCQNVLCDVSIYGTNLGYLDTRMYKLSTFTPELNSWYNGNALSDPYFSSGQCSSYKSVNITNGNGNYAGFDAGNPRNQILNKLQWEEDSITFKVNKTFSFGTIFVFIGEKSYRLSIPQKTLTTNAACPTQTAIRFETTSTIPATTFEATTSTFTAFKSSSIVPTSVITQQETFSMTNFTLKSAVPHFSSQKTFPSTKNISNTRTTYATACYTVTISQTCPVFTIPSSLNLGTAPTILSQMSAGIAERISERIITVISLLLMF